MCYIERIYDVFSVRRQGCLDYYISIKGDWVIFECDFCEMTADSGAGLDKTLSKLNAQPQSVTVKVKTINGIKKHQIDCVSGLIVASLDGSV